MPVIDLGSVVGPQGPQGATGATGAQGIQGNPGPNQVTDQTSTNLNGVLFGSQSRVTVKPVDSTPTADSTNLVSSGGTYDAIKTLVTGEEIAKVLHDPAGQNVAVGEYAIYNGQLYTSNTAITSSMAASTFASYLTAVSGGGLNNAIGILRLEFPVVRISIQANKTAQVRFANGDTISCLVVTAGWGDQWAGFYYVNAYSNNPNGQVTALVNASAFTVTRVAGGIDIKNTGSSTAEACVMVPVDTRSNTPTVTIV